MDISNMKNIVVLKNLPSNLVEEAIVVIKHTKKSKELIKNATTNCLEKREIPKEYIVKEAEMLVANYITSLEKNKYSKINNSNVNKKYIRIKKISICLGFLLIISIIFNIL